jgi:ATP-binding cassette, subfamily B, multidrug efflux pump
MKSCILRDFSADAKNESFNPQRVKLMDDYGYYEDDHPTHFGDIHLWGRLIRFMVPQWRGVALAVLLSFVITCSSLALPWLFQQAMDRYIVDASQPMAERLSAIGTLAGAFLIVILIGFVANFFQVLVLEWSGQRAMHGLRQSMFAHIVELNLSFFQSRPVGRLVTRLTNDIQNLHEMFTSVIVTLFNDGIRLFGILGILFWMNWRLALLVGLTFPVILVVTVYFGRLSRDAFRRIRSELAGINAFIQEAITGISIIQLFLRERDFHRSFLELSGRYFAAARYQIHVFGVFVPMIEVLNAFALALILWYGGGQTIRDHMTIGVLAAFISYMRLFFQPLREVSQKYSIVQSAMASAERIFQVLEKHDRLPVVDAPVRTEQLEGRIDFEHVDFGYEPDRVVLEDLSFRVDSGETLAIVGATGSGKTTVINLLERFYDPARGSIKVDGLDLRALDPAWLRRQIGLVMQDVFIVPGTFRENVLLDLDLSEARLQEVVRLSQLEEVVNRLPQGLETRIGEGGMDLSAGQKQLLAIARVLARDPRILVLDEATANVDTETEMLVEQAIQLAFISRTNIVIAHRLSTIRRADRILVMDHGRIVEEGTHEALMACQGFYYHLQTLQNGQSEGDPEGS